jgi:hypothetical protein
MQTIEQAATNAYGIEVLSSGCNAGVTFGKEMFKQGVEFAQRWIPVSEELPEKNIDVIAKSNNTFWIARLQSHGKGLTLYSIKASRYSEEFEATHWRPISFL